MLTKTYDVVYWGEDDKEAQTNMSYDIEEGYVGVPGF